MTHRPKPDNHQPIPSHAKQVFQGTRWEVYQWEQELFDGSKTIYESVKRFDSVIIYPIVDETVLILEEHQPHWLKKSDTVVAGGIDHNEDPLTAAKRELQEETGMIFKDFYLVSVEQKSKDVSSYVYTFVAKNLTGTTEKQKSSGEITEPRFVSFNELVTLTKQRRFFHKPTLVDEFIIQDKVDTLFDIFRNPENHTII